MDGSDVSPLLLLSPNAAPLTLCSVPVTIGGNGTLCRRINPELDREPNRYLLSGLEIAALSVDGTRMIIWHIVANVHNYKYHADPNSDTCLPARVKPAIRSSVFP